MFFSAVGRFSNCTDVLILQSPKFQNGSFTGLFDAYNSYSMYVYNNDQKQESETEGGMKCEYNSGK